jgi:hypothetical protein
MIRCAECKHENNPAHHFCGMCGASLLKAGSEQVDSEPSSSAPAPTVAGPSFLGLADPASETDYSYLLKDEPQPRHWLAYSALILLFATGGVLAWRWRNEGYAWRALMASRRMLGTASQPAKTDPAATTPAEEQKKEEQKVVAEPGSTAPTQTNDGAPPSEPDHLASPTVANLPSAESPASPASSNSPATSKLRPASSSEVIEPAPAERQKISASTQRDDKLAEGEALLYGNSGSTNCDRARTDLFIAAEHDNPEAQSILGTMFATGHCVAVDLPAAYQWLSRAQRQDPANRRIASSLRIVWGEMTAEQQQAMARNQR